MSHDQEGDPSVGPRWRKLIKESQDASKAYRLSNGGIERERARFAEAMVLIREGKLEEARRLWWWPANEDPPKKHWSETPVQACKCRWKATEGPLGICGYCGGLTPASPSVLPRR